MVAQGGTLASQLPRRKVLVGGQEVVEKLHALEPMLGEGDEGGAVVGFVGCFDLGEHGVALVGHDLAGYVD